MGEINESSSMVISRFQTPPSRSLPFREDCWSEEATATLIESWGRRYLELNRGNLRRKDWQEVAVAVNAIHGHTKKTRRTDVQCKNRIDTCKKKYKIEKAKIAESNGMMTSSWRFYKRVEDLIGLNVKSQAQKRLLSSSPHMAPGIMLYKKPPAAAVPVEHSLLPQKRQLSGVDDSYFRKNYSAMAAAAAAAAEEEAEDYEDREGGSEEEDDEDVDVDGEGREDRRGTENHGMKKLAKAIERFGEIYERVENMKQRQMVELEKQRMQFSKDLEVQRMQLIMDTQVQLEKVKHANRSGSDDVFS